jgi:hypothetical protein
MTRSTDAARALGRALLSLATALGRIVGFVAKTTAAIAGARTFADDNALVLYKHPEDYRP